MSGSNYPKRTLTLSGVLYCAQETCRSYANIHDLCVPPLEYPKLAPIRHTEHAHHDRSYPRTQESCDTGSFYPPFVHHLPTGFHSAMVSYQSHDDPPRGNYEAEAPFSTTSDEFSWDYFGCTDVSNGDPLGHRLDLNHTYPSVAINNSRNGASSSASLFINYNGHLPGASDTHDSSSTWNVGAGHNQSEPRDLNRETDILFMENILGTDWRYGNHYNDQPGDEHSFMPSNIDTPIDPGTFPPLHPRLHSKNNLGLGLSAYFGDDSPTSPSSYNHRLSINGSLENSLDGILASLRDQAHVQPNRLPLTTDEVSMDPNLAPLLPLNSPEPTLPTSISRRRCRPGLIHAPPHLRKPLEFLLNLIRASDFFKNNELEPLVYQARDLLSEVEHQTGVTLEKNARRGDSIYSLFIDRGSNKVWLCGHRKGNMSRAVGYVRSLLDHRPFPCPRRSGECSGKNCMAGKRVAFFTKAMRDDHLKRSTTKEQCAYIECGKWIRKGGLPRHLRLHSSVDTSYQRGEIPSLEGEEE